MKSSGNILIESGLEKPVAELAAEAGLKGDVRLEELPCGGNNRVFRLYDSMHSYLLKWYFTHSNDPRNRLDAEFSFLVFAWENGVHRLPRPIACSRKNSLALYEFIGGKRISSHKVTRSQVEQAADFFYDLNIHKNSESASRIPSASEACFSLAEHMKLVEQRVSKLKSIESNDRTDNEALDFVINHLDPAMKTVHDQITTAAEQMQLDVDLTLEASDRCLSPSDFGFHNAIVTGDNNIHFIDFEYAGWDDPAKTICDFFCQLAISVPKKYFPYFLSKISRSSADPRFLNQRVTLLYPLHHKMVLHYPECFSPGR